MEMFVIGVCAFVGVVAYRYAVRPILRGLGVIGG